MLRVLCPSLVTLESTSYLPRRNVEKYLTSVSTTSSPVTPSYSSPRKDNTQTSLTRGFYSIIRTENSNSTVDIHSYITRREYTTRSTINRGQNDCSYSTGEMTLNVLTSHQVHRSQKPPQEPPEFLGNNNSFQADKEVRHQDTPPNQLDHLRPHDQRLLDYRC